MISFSTNPFAVTKAVDLNDEQIRKQFVPFGKGLAILNATEPMPQFILGAKGGGRTHLLRRLGFPLQLEVGSGVPEEGNTKALLEAIRAQGYLGVYIRASGLNGSRFSGKGHENQDWARVFGQYFELWLCQSLKSVWLTTGSDWPVDNLPATYSLLNLDFEESLRAMDRAINDVAFGKAMPLNELATPGAILFQFVRFFVKQLDLDEGFKVTFLLDEFENLTEGQQRFVNSLVREREDPANFIIGSRSYGVKTQSTLAAQEVNRRGSEFDELDLDEFYASDRPAYVKFVEQIVEARLAAAGSSLSIADVRNSFGSPDEAVLRLRELHDAHGRPYLRNFSSKLRQAFLDEDTILDFEEQLDLGDPVLEKAAILRFYQTWSSSRKLSVEDFAAAVWEFREMGVSAQQFLGHRRLDLQAQLFKDYRVEQPIGSFEHILACSYHNPRNALIVLKNIYRWSEFFGEGPLVEGNQISPEARRRGLLDGSEWYFQDSRPLGEEAKLVDRALARLGAFLRRLRFSDKPVESNCSWISFEDHDLSSSAGVVLSAAVGSGVLVRKRYGTVDRNSGQVVSAVGIHPMLSPRFDLGTARRGAIKLSARELDAIFGADVSEQAFDSIISERLVAMTAPFARQHPGEATLFD